MRIMQTTWLVAILLVASGCGSSHPPGSPQALLLDLQAGKPARRSQAALVLGNLFSTEAATAKPLNENWQAELPAVPVNAAGTAKDLADAVAGLAEALKDEEEEVRTSAAFALERIGPRAKGAVVELGAALQDSSPAVRRMAASALGRIGPDAAPAATILVVLLQDDDERVRGEASKALPNLGKEAVGPVIRVLREGDKEERSRACLLLGGFGAKAQEAVPSLIEALRDSDTQQQACYALGKIGPAAGAAVAPLIRVLREGDTQLQQHACDALGKIGPAAKKAVPELRRLLQDKDPGQRRRAAMALWRIDRQADAAVTVLLEDNQGWAEPDFSIGPIPLEELGGDAVPFLAQALNDSQAAVRNAAACALARLGSKAKSAAAALERALDDPHALVQVHAAEALCRIESDHSKRALETLTGALKHERPKVREIAAVALGRIGPAAASAGEALIAAAVDKEAKVRLAAVQALGKLGEPAIPPLLKALEDEDRNVRVAAAAALAINPKGADADEALRKAKEQDRPSGQASSHGPGMPETIEGRATGR